MSGRIQLTVLEGGRKRPHMKIPLAGWLIALTLGIAGWTVLAATVYGLYLLLGWAWR